MRRIYIRVPSSSRIEVSDIPMATVYRLREEIEAILRDLNDGFKMDTFIEMGE